MFLCEAYKDYFPIGAAISCDQIKTHKEIIINHFNSITPENELKFGQIHPKEGEFIFNNADNLVQFSSENNLMIRGHTLVCNFPPEWVFKDKDGRVASRELVLDRMESHINKVVGRYKEQIYCWDVVNEAIDDSDDVFLRENKWKASIGNEYVDKAFYFAHEANPNALLFYNDYNAIIEGKRNKIYELVKGMIDRGVPIHGIGLQGHFDIYFPTTLDIRKTIEKFADLGIKIQITEMDISVYRYQDRRVDLKKPTAKMLKKQTQLYEEIFAIYREYREVISGVTVWGITDDHTWRDYYPVEGRKDWPLLFNEDFTPKPAVKKILTF